ncbi:NADPH-dependent thioredoxin reductase 3 [Cucumispora dikerogammari]|nr:NADPH-dependent thioredoxin reductase 3 [Cucumispora dikerogammari]
MSVEYNKEEDISYKSHNSGSDINNVSSISTVGKKMQKIYKKHKVIIIGATSGAHTAAIYAATANIDFVTIIVPFALKDVVEKDIDTLSYPGNIEGVSYACMFENTKKQCERFGCKIYDCKTLKVSFDEEKALFIIESNNKTFFSCEWLFFEIMDNINFGAGVLENDRSIKIDFYKDFSQLCASGCMTLKKFQLNE